MAVVFIGMIVIKSRKKLKTTQEKPMGSEINTNKLKTASAEQKL